MSKQQIILKIMDGARRLGIRPSDILGKGTNIFRFPKQGDINPFDPNMLVSMKQFGQDSVQAAKQKLADGLRYLTTENEMNLTNYLNNLNDFLRMGKGQEPIKEGLAGTKTADVFDIKNKKLLTGKEKETLEQTQGLSPGVDPESTMGQIQNIGKGLEEFLDQVQGITPEARRKLNQEKINQVIKQVTDVGGSMDDARDLLSKTTSLDILLQQTLPRYVKAKNLGAKTKPEIEMIEEAEDSFDVYKDRPEKLEEHFKEFYTPRLIISRIEDSIAENLRQTGKFTEDEIDNLTIYGNVDKSNPVKYLEDMKETLGDVDYDLDTTVYKNYADEYLYGSDKYNQKIKGIKPKVDDEEPFADGGRVGFRFGGGYQGGATNQGGAGPASEPDDRSSAAQTAAHNAAVAAAQEANTVEEKMNILDTLNRFKPNTFVNPYNYSINLNKNIGPFGLNTFINTLGILGIDDPRTAVNESELDDYEISGGFNTNVLGGNLSLGAGYNPTRGTNLGLSFSKQFNQGGRVGFSMGGGTKGKVIQGIMNLIRSKYGEEAIDTLENLYSSGKLKLNDIKKQFMEDREAVESFQQREKLSNMPDEIKVEPRKILDVPEVPEGFSTSKEKLLEQFPEIDEEFAETMMEMDKDLLGRTIMMLKNRRLNPELYDELLEKYGDTLEFQSKFDEAIRKTKNAYGGLI